MINEKIISEFKNDILKLTGLPDWLSLSWYNQIEKAAINLFDKARVEGRKEFICKNCADIWNVDTSDEYEAGRQSAQKEINDLNILILNERAEKQVKLIEEIEKKQLCGNCGKPKSWHIRGLFSNSEPRYCTMKLQEEFEPAPQAEKKVKGE